MSVVAVQIAEEYRQIPVAEEVDVTHVVRCPTVFSGSVAMVRDLVVLICKNALQMITTSRRFELNLFVSCDFHILLFFCISLVHS